jgi:putative spermidine/putrescine transport system permease protein
VRELAIGRRTPLGIVRRAVEWTTGPSGQGVRRLLLLLLPAAFLTFFFIVPLVGIALRSVGWPVPTLAHYERILRVPAYLAVTRNTFEIAASVTASCLLLGYPLAHALANSRRWVASTVLILVIIPLWTSLLVRNYSWMVLLGNNGLVNNLLKSLGLISEPLPLLYNRFGVLVGMTHILLPYMVLSISVVMQGIDPLVMRAAYNLGAGPVRAFWHVYLPLCLPGVAAGCLLVFVMALGFFVTPALLGGARGIMLSMVIESQINQVVNWELASAVAIVLLLITLPLLLLLFRQFAPERLLGGRT